MIIASKLHLDSEMSGFQSLTDSCEGITLATIFYCLIANVLQVEFANKVPSCGIENNSFRELFPASTGHFAKKLVFNAHIMKQLLRTKRNTIFLFLATL